MFGFTTSKCKRRLQIAFSDCFDPLKDELGTVPEQLNHSKYITASMLGVCEAYAEACGIHKTLKVALITDAAFEEVFRRDTTNVLNQVDQWLNKQDSEFMQAYQQAKVKLESNAQTLDLDWLKRYASENFEPATNLML